MVMTLRDWIEEEHFALNKIDKGTFLIDLYSDWNEYGTEEYRQKKKKEYEEAVFMKEEGEKELTEARKEIKKYLLDILENY